MTHEGDKAILEAHKQEHSERLSTTCQKRRDVARAAFVASGLLMPVSNSEWLKWLEDNWSLYVKTLAEAPKDRQSRYSKRITAKPDLHAAHRLQPKLPELRTWARQVRDNRANFYGLKLGENSEKLLMVYAAGLGPRCFAFPLLRSRKGNLFFEFHVLQSFTEMRDIQLLARDVGFQDDPLEMCICEVRLTLKGTSVSVEVLGKRDLEVVTRRRKSDGSPDGGSETGEDEGLREELSGTDAEQFVCR